MLGLINKAIQCFVLDTYGRETWREMAQSAALPVMQFEAMLIYEDTLTEQALDATARFLDKPRTDVLEDIGTYLASHPNVEALRRLLRFGGAHFIEFLYSLDDLHDRARMLLASSAFLAKMVFDGVSERRRQDFVSHVLKSLAMD